MNIFLEPFKYFIKQPYLILIPIFIYLILYIYETKRNETKNNESLLSIILGIWILYFLYELFVYFYTNKYSVGVPIRFDLLFIVPIIYIISFGITSYYIINKLII